MSHFTRVGIAVLIVGLSSGVTPAAAQLVNGDFETPTVPSGERLISYSSGDNIGGWHVASGTVELIGPSTWNSQSGQQSLDLSGISAGSITQNIVTVPGKSYLLSFWMAGNFEFGSLTKEMDVSFGSHHLPTQSYVYAGQSFHDMQWSQRQFTVTASSSSTALTFTSLDPSISGPALDNVTLVPLDDVGVVPEPGALALFLPALGVVAVARRKRFNLISPTQ